jgi:hypothetical protein
MPRKDPVSDRAIIQKVSQQLRTRHEAPPCSEGKRTITVSKINTITNGGWQSATQAWTGCIGLLTGCK